MTARVLDGQALSATMREEIKPEVQAFVQAHGRPPGLGIVLVGADPASHVYVRNKLKAAEDVGFYADCERMPAESTLSDASSASPCFCTGSGAQRVLLKRTRGTRGRRHLRSG